MSHKSPQSLKSDHKLNTHGNYRSLRSPASQQITRHGITKMQSEMETPKFYQRETENIKDLEKTICVLKSQIRETNLVLDDALEKNKNDSHKKSSLEKKYEIARTRNNELKILNQNLSEKLSNFEKEMQKSMNFETNNSENYQMRNANKNSRNLNKNTEDSNDMNSLMEEFSTFSIKDSKFHVTTHDHEMEKRDLIEKINSLESNLKRKHEAIVKIREKYKINQVNSQELNELKKYKAQCLFLQKQSEEFGQKIENLTDLNRNLNVQLDLVKQENNNLSSEIENMKLLGLKSIKSKSEGNIYAKMEINRETKKQISHSKHSKLYGNKTNSHKSLEKDFKENFLINEFPSWWLKHMQHPNSDV